MGLNMNEQKMVFCKKLGKNLPALSEAPLKGPVGQVILDNVSEEAWQDWVEAEIKIINEERLDLSEERAQIRLFEQMVEFLSLGDLVDLDK